jgi:aryl-alcohol dehydrogenase-like predicted oxidoreductase
MRTVEVGSLTCSVIGVGCNQFGPTLDAQATSRVVATALEAGVTFFDVADEYGPDGIAEEYLGRALSGHRDEVVIATKFGSRLRGDPATGGASAAWITRAVEDSLRRLGTDRIDLYQQHFPDEKVSDEETAAAVDQLVQDGKVVEVGVCNLPATDVEARIRAIETARRQSLAAVQDRYNLLRQEASEQLLPCARAHGLAFIPYFPLASGILGGRYRPGESPPTDSRFGRHVDPPQARHIIDRDAPTVLALQEWAAHRDHQVPELAIAWLASQPGVGPVIAGVTTPQQVRTNATAAAWQLTAEEIDEVGALGSRRPQPLA